MGRCWFAHPKSTVHEYLKISSLLPNQCEPPYEGDNSRRSKGKTSQCLVSEMPYGTP